jgi:signal transduction histidine kinase
MLLILTVGLVIASILLIFLRKSRESILLLGLCVSLMLEIGGVMIFIAKKGGVSPEVIQFLYFSKEVQHRMQFLLITLGQLGYLIAVGRVCFPLFLLELALQYSMIPFVRKGRYCQRAALVLPLGMLVLYFPAVYRWLVAGNDQYQIWIADFVIAWITLYLILAIVLLLIEFFSITMKFCKRQFSEIMLFLICVTGLYLLYYEQDPGQVYRFYSFSLAWNRGIGYLQFNPSLASYMLLVIVNLIGAFFGFLALLRYTHSSYEDEREEVVMERKFDSVRIGVSMFVHSMKNQLLSTRVIYKRIDQLYEQPELDTGKLKEYVDALREVNDGMLSRIEELYRSVKKNSIEMVPLTMDEIFAASIDRFHEKYPEIAVEVQNDDVRMVLADKLHFCEAIYNLLINAQEAILNAERGEQGNILLYCKNERLYTVIEVRDNGKGMTKSQIKKIFDPFYSSKNSNFNWGMGLYYVREIAKSHLGSVRVESEVGKGSSFYILLPRYE